MPYLSSSSLFLSQVAEALVTCVFCFSGNTRARVPLTRPLLGTRSLPGQLAESRLMCWAADSRLPGRAPAARVRGPGPQELQPGLLLGDTLGFKNGCRSGEEGVTSQQPWSGLRRPEVWEESSSQGGPAQGARSQDGVHSRGFLLRCV